MGGVGSLICQACCISPPRAVRGPGPQGARRVQSAPSGKSIGGGREGHGFNRQAQPRQHFFIWAFGHPPRGFISSEKIKICADGFRAEDIVEARGRTLISFLVSRNHRRGRLLFRVRGRFRPPDPPKGLRRHVFSGRLF